MADPTQDVNADSSTATATFDIPREPAARAEWLKTGKLPEPQAKPEASGTHEEAHSSTSEKSGTASEAGKGTQERKPPRDNAAGRLNELLADLREAGLSPSELKTFKGSYQRVQQQQSAEAPNAAPAEKTVNPAELKAPIEPKTEDFKTWEELQAAERKYARELTAYEVQKALAEDRAQRAQEAANVTVHQKMLEAKGRYGDEAIGIIRDTAKAFTGDAEVPQVVKAMLNDSPVWTDLLYTLGGKAEDLQAFLQLSKSDPGGAVRKIVLMEQLVQQELAKGGKAAGAGESGEATPRDATGKFKAPGKKESDAPPPATEVSGRGTPPPDGVERAVKDGDARAYFRLKNEEARIRGRR